MLLQPPVVQEHFFLETDFRLPFLRPRFFVHAFAILAVFVPHFFVFVVFPYFIYRSLRTEMNLDQMGLAILRAK